MPSDRSVVADPANGFALVAGQRVAMSPSDASGAIRFGGESGTLLRPLTFGQRTSVVTAASLQPQPRDSVAAAVLAAACAGGEVRGALLETLAMWMAGAEWDAPTFADTTLTVARAARWSPAEILAAPATEVDRLAVYLVEQERGSEWTAIVFSSPPADDLETVRARFADQLLRRSAMSGESQVAAPEGNRARLIDARAEHARRPVMEAGAVEAVGTAAQPGIGPTPSTFDPAAFTQSAAELRHASSDDVRLDTPASRFRFIHADGIVELGLLSPNRAKQSDALRVTRANHSDRLPAVAVRAPMLPVARAVAELRSDHGTAPGEPSVDGFALPRLFAMETPLTAPPDAAAQTISDSENRGADTPDEPFLLASALAVMLDDEADLRGIER